MRKATACILASMMAFTTGATAFGADVMEKGDYTAQVNGTWVQQKIYENKDHAHMFPVREVGELLGYEVVWNRSARTVTVLDGDVSVSFAIGQDAYISDGETISLRAVPELKDGVSYVPSLFFSKFFPVEMENLEHEVILVKTKTTE